MITEQIWRAIKYLGYPIAYSNCLVRDLYSYMNSLGMSWKEKGDVIYSYERQWDGISSMLYEKLSSKDRDVFVRFLLKRFFAIQTITLDEQRSIDEAFLDAEHLCIKRDRSMVYTFIFHDHEIKFAVPVVEENSLYNALEKRLMSHYEVAHAFFLLEYEKEGFNPQNGEVIFDCGAADGDTAIVFSCLYPDSQIYSFEYGERQLAYAQDNLVKNGASNVKLEKRFLYSKAGDFYLDDNYHVQEAAGTGGIAVRTISIDDYVAKYSIENIGLIKMDIEGGEMEALKGARETIIAQRPLLYIPIYHLNSDIYDIPKFLHDLNMPMEFSFKWTEKLVWGMDGVLFVRFM